MNAKYHALKVAYTALLYFSPVLGYIIEQAQAGHVDYRLVYWMAFPIAIDILKRTLQSPTLDLPDPVTSNSTTTWTI